MDVSCSSPTLMLKQALAETVNTESILYIFFTTDQKTVPVLLAVWTTKKRHSDLGPFPSHPLKLIIKTHLSGPKFAELYEKQTCYCQLVFLWGLIFCQNALPRKHVEYISFLIFPYSFAFWLVLKPALFISVCNLHFLLSAFMAQYCHHMQSAEMSITSLCTSTTIYKRCSSSKLSSTSLLLVKSSTGYL